MNDVFELQMRQRAESTPFLSEKLLYQGQAFFTEMSGALQFLER